TTYLCSSIVFGTCINRTPTKLRRNRIGIIVIYMDKWNKIVFYCFILLSAFSCKQKDGAIIKGRIINLQTPYILASYISADTLVIDTISTDNRGRFRYRCHIDTMTTFSL